MKGVGVRVRGREAGRGGAFFSSQRGAGGVFEAREVGGGGGGFLLYIMVI